MGTSLVKTRLVILTVYSNPISLELWCIEVTVSAHGVARANGILNHTLQSLEAMQTGQTEQLGAVAARGHHDNIM